MTNERELLRRALLLLDYSRKESDAFEVEALAYLDTPSNDAEEPVAWMFFSSKGRPHYHLNEYQALEGLKMYGGSKVIALYEHPAPRKQDDEPAAIRDAYTAGLFDGKALTPRKSFMRLSEEEICIVMDNVLEGGGWSDVARAIEDALEEKNK